MVSLERQRLRIVGQRGLGITFLVLAGLFLALTTFAIVVVGLRTSFYYFPVMALAFGVIGFRQVRAAHRELAAFEAEHGAGAGVQEPIR
jgi:hypothetical protein